MKFQITLTLSILLFTASAQSIEEKFKNHQSSFGVEKVYIHHNQPYYAPGDTIWCKAYLVDGQGHQAFDAQPILYADWIDPEGRILNTYILKVKDGGAPFEIPTAKTDAGGTYALRGYTLYQKNFDEHYLFQKEVRLIDSLALPAEETGREKGNEFSIRFYPEGGELVSGLNGKVAFKAPKQPRRRCVGYR